MGENESQTKDVEKFLLIEYEGLRAETEGKIDDNVFKYTIVFPGIVWGWFLSHNVGKSFYSLKWVPFLSPGFFISSIFFQIHDLFALGKHLRKIEDYFDLPQGLGWDDTGK